MPILDCAYQAPRSLSEALEFKAAGGAEAVFMAGGTDLLVRARQELARPATVISLKHLAAELSGVDEDGGALVIGAMTPLAEAAAHPLVAGRLPGLAEALMSIGAPTLQQRVGTVGGNLCAQTRCIYYNQSAFWRSGLAPCFKLGGEVCHPGGATADRCRSTCQSDGAVMLAALGASVALAAPGGRRELALEEFYTGKGEQPHALEPDELLLSVRVPLAERQGSSYAKLAARKAIDYPLLSAAAAVSLDERGKVAVAALALGGVFAAPLMMKDAVAALAGGDGGEEALAAVAKKAGSHAEPFFIENHSAPAEWRRRMVPVLARRALSQALARARG